MNFEIVIKGIFWTSYGCLKFIKFNVLLQKLLMYVYMMLPLVSFYTGTELITLK